MKPGGTLANAGTEEPAVDGVQADAADAADACGGPLLEAGDRIGEYVVVRVIGSGGFGTVYEGEQPVIGKRVAIKVLAQRYSGDPEAVSRFVAEARVANRIGHHNIVGTFSFGKLDDGRHYHVMDFVEGEALDAMIRRHGALPLSDALPILRGVASALDAAHKKGVVHRDLKPANVLVAEEDGELVPKVIDFGIAKLLSDQERGHKTQSGAIMGTPMYMAPEQCRGQPVDHLSDAYSFGVMAYELLTGEPPFSGADSLDLLMKHTSERPEAPSKRKPGLPAAIDDTILALLAKEQTERPSPLGKVVKSLSRVAGGRGLPSSVPTEPPSMAYKDTLPTGSKPERGKPQRRLLLPGLAIACVAAAAVALMMRKAPQVAPEPTRAPSAIEQASSVPNAPLSTSVVTPAQPAKEVVVEIQGTPSGTQVVATDGGVLGTAPGKLQLPGGSAPTRIELRKAGYETTTRTINTSKDSVLVVHLERSRGAAVAQKPAPRSSKHKPGPDDFEDPFK